MIGILPDSQTTQLLLSGLRLTVALTLVTSLLALVLGVAAGTARIAGARGLRLLAAAHVEIHRNVPALVLVIFWAFAVPNLFPVELRRALFFDNALVHWVAEWSGVPLVYYAVATVIALTLNTSAYLAELFRAGVGSLAQEHVDAARTLGASRREVFVRILLPQGVRAAFPAISSRLIHNMKNTSLASFVAVPELFHGTQTAITQSFRAVEFLVLAAILYLALAYLLSAALRRIERWMERPQTRRSARSVLIPAGERNG
jgi:polar amino acid transport system permease protein